jgi:hypothetical protein
MSRARDFADLAGSADAGGLTGRNLIINGAMQVAQRGTSSSAGGYCALDRFFINLSGASATFSQETVTLGDSVVGDFINYARLNVTTGNNFCMIRHRIEDVQSVPEGTATISFYAKGTNPGGGVCTVQASQRFGTSGSSDVDISGQTFTLTSSWQRFDFQFTIPSISGKTIGTGGTSFQFDIGQGSDTSTDAWQIDITGVQLEVGEQATPFEHRSFGDELARCQRYYEQTGAGGPAKANSSTEFWIGNSFRVVKRADPTASVVDPNSYVRVYEFGVGDRNSDSTPAISGTVANPSGAIIRVGTFSGISAGDTGILGGKDGDSSANVFAFDAEL